MKLCTIDTNNVNSILYAGLYFNINCTISNLIGIDSVDIIKAQQNNFGNNNLVLQVIPNDFLTTVSFDLTFPKTLVNSYFNINGYTSTYHFPIHDLVCYSDDSLTITIRMTSRDLTYTNYTIVLTN